MKVWVWVGETDYEGDLDVLCLQLSKKRVVFIMESGDYEFDDRNQAPDFQYNNVGWLLMPEGRP